MTATDLACGPMRLLIDAIDRHEKKFGPGRKPQHFVLHPPGLQHLNDELRRRFGEVTERHEGGQRFMGVPIYVCMCAQNAAEDQYVGIDGEHEPI